ncbi:AAA family ATPase [Candidatus Pacearchaeota archaeon]|nr:AAA family ATPase [Candidatus Pacearchaeota archaeon]
MGIIKDKSVFDINYIPEELPVRQELVDEIFKKITLMNRYILFLGGMPGNGKTISVTKALDRLSRDVIDVFINCSEINSYTAIAKEIIEKVKCKPYKEKGKSRYELAEDLKKLLKTKRNKKIIITFDEVDKLILKKDNHVEIFFPLVNHGSASFIFISNDASILSKMDGRIASRFSSEKKILETYCPDDIFQILLQRAEKGLIEGSWTIDLLIKMAKLTSDTSGDIRYALKLLEKSAVLTDMANEGRISEDKIKDAIKEVQISEIEEVFPNLPKHLKIVVIALCHECRKNNGFAITSDAYKFYSFHARSLQYGHVGERQYRDYLNSLEMMGLFEFQWRSNPKGQGRIRIASPLNFDAIKFYEKFVGNTGEDGAGG